MTKPMTTLGLIPTPLDRSTEASRAANGLSLKAGRPFGGYYQAKDSIEAAID